MGTCDGRESRLNLAHDGSRSIGGLYDRESDNEDTAEDTQEPNALNTMPSLQQHEIDLYKKEKELAECELVLTRCELEAMRERLWVEQIVGDGQPARGVTMPIGREQSGTTNGNRVTAANGGSTNGVMVQSGQPRTNIAAIADLLNNFDGRAGNYETWEKQIRLLKMTYELEDDAAKILIGMRLKERTIE